MESKDEIFHCNMCGMCCRNVRRYQKILPKLKVLLNDDSLCFPYNDINGVCEHLTSENKCAIYDHRPLVCNTLAMFPLLKKTTGCSMNEINELQKLSCLINQGGLS